MHDICGKLNSPSKCHFRGVKRFKCGKVRAIRSDYRNFATHGWADGQDPHNAEASESLHMLIFGKGLHFGLSSNFISFCVAKNFAQDITLSILADFHVCIKSQGHYSLLQWLTHSIHMLEIPEHDIFSVSCLGCDQYTLVPRCGVLYETNGRSSFGSHALI